MHVLDSITAETPACAVHLTAVATIAAVTVLMSGCAVAGPYFEHSTKAEIEVARRPSAARVDRLLIAFNREQPVPPASRAPHPTLALVPTTIPKSSSLSTANPLEGKPLRYLIGTDIPGLGREGEIPKSPTVRSNRQRAASASNTATCSTKRTQVATAPISTRPIRRRITTKARLIRRALAGRATLRISTSAPLRRASNTSN
jgi:hypothetical protein